MTGWDTRGRGDSTGLDWECQENGECGGAELYTNEPSLLIPQPPLCPESQHGPKYPLESHHGECSTPYIANTTC